MPKSMRATWTKRLEDWKESGLDAPAFAAKIGVSSRTLTWWRWRLGPQETARDAKALALRSDEMTPLTFVEMTDVVKDPIEIVLRNQIRVRIGAAFDGATLGRVLDVLERR